MNHYSLNPVSGPGPAGPSSGRPVPNGPQELEAVQPDWSDQSAGPSRSGRDALAEFGDPVGDLAAVGDAALGREGPPSLLPDEVGDLTTDQLLPPRLAEHPTVRLVAGHLAGGAAAVALIAVVFAGGTVSGVVASAFQAARGTASIGAALTFFDAFFVTLALSLTTAICWFLARSEVVRGWPAVGVATAGCLLSVALAGSLGIAGPTVDQVLAQMHGNPLAQMAGAFRAFLVFYGPVPFLGGVATGAVAGNLCYRLAQGLPRG